MTILERVRRACVAWFSAQAWPQNLAVVRIVVFWILLERLLSGGFRRFARLPEALRIVPPGIGPVLDLLPAHASTVVALQIAASVCALFALVGLWTRPAAGLSALFSSYVLGLPYLFGKVDHTLHHLIWFALLLAASPSGDALSLDAWRARRRGAPPPGPARAYALPIRLMWLLIGVAYFFPGYYKLRAGPRWVTSDNLQLLMYESWRHHGALPALRIDLHPWLCHAAAAGIIGFELGFIFLILPRRMRPFAAALGLLFHASTAYFMRIYFVELMLCYIVFVDWRALALRLRPERAQRQPAAPAPDWRPSAVVGSALLALNVFCGAWRIDSWPFSVYPRFDAIHTQAVTTKVEAALESASGSTPLRLPLRGAMLQRMARLPEGEERDRRLRALAELLVRGGAEPQPGEGLRIYAVTYSTLPGRWHEPPLRRRLLFDYAAGRDVESHAQP